MANMSFLSIEDKPPEFMAYPRTALHRLSTQPERFSQRFSALMPQLEDLDFGAGLDLYPEGFRSRGQ